MIYIDFKIIKERIKSMSADTPSFGCTRWSLGTAQFLEQDIVNPWPSVWVANLMTLSHTGFSPIHNLEFSLSKPKRLMRIDSGKMHFHSMQWCGSLNSHQDKPAHVTKRLGTQIYYSLLVQDDKVYGEH